MLENYVSEKRIKKNYLSEWAMQLKDDKLKWYFIQWFTICLMRCPAQQQQQKIKWEIHQKHDLIFKRFYDFHFDYVRIST